MKPNKKNIFGAAITKRQAACDSQGNLGDGERMNGRNLHTGTTRRRHARLVGEESRQPNLGRSARKV